jgi:hypothetical protein
MDYSKAGNGQPSLHLFKNLADVFHHRLPLLFYFQIRSFFVSIFKCGSRRGIDIA